MKHPVTKEEDEDAEFEAHMDEFFEGLWELRYAGAWPWERWLMNYDRRRQGKPPLRLP